MSFAFIDAEKAHHPIDALCRNLGVSRSGYQAWVRRPASARSRADLTRADRIAAIHERSRGTYGSPRVHAELRAHGERVGRKRVARRMAAEGLRARPRRRDRATSDSKRPRPVAPNTLARAFETTAPDRAWVGDVTAVWAGEG